MNLSSHDPILTKLVVEDTSKKQECTFAATYTEFNQKKIIWDESKIPAYQALAAQALSDAHNFWHTPETIPLLITLFSNLLVKSATMIFDTKTRKTPNIQKSSRNQENAEKLVTKYFKVWKKAGKPSSKTDITRLNYTSARSNLQRLIRYEDNLCSIRENNFLMNSLHNDRNKIYARMKKFRGESNKNLTSVLHTPVGSFHGEDVLEGFAADAEHLGRLNEGSSSDFDQDFYKLCKLDNLYIFEFNGEEPIHIPPMNLIQLEHILHSKMKLGKSCDISWLL